MEAPSREIRRAAELPRARAQQPQQDYWQQEQSRREAPASLAERLRNPTDLRTALVLGEILRRKF
ncbi:hypothetical protein MUN84_01545 [Hymenobacter sp. 5516J-16]|uniref:hypothetical protein n=1 Tax=Hymenobacter sp. 5516J-16 TaxID=2932253 RepID=UPI001FCFF698|nr:hypothetical protein [Hymenobacter sp. 5516J-16]UOQ77430.1 hypothetical protein MUN84_01545 [Hymenobacter sp. 5516J-16]